MEIQTVNSKPGADALAGTSKKGGFSLLRLVKRLVIALPIVVMLIVFANWLWLISGSNRWDLKIDKNGTQVYTMKTPGSESLRIRAVTQSREFSMSNIIAPALDESIANDCSKWVAGCQSYKILTPWDPRRLNNVTMWTIKLFPPFKPREMLLQNQVHVDPVTRVVTLESLAVPNHLPPDNCCVRLEHAHNVWRYTPMPDGSIQVELLYDLDMGGFFPQILLNLGAPSQLYTELTEHNPAMLRQEKYRNAHFDFLDPATSGVNAAN
ncbi:hypothetical protein AWB69_02904 [Caballeronia udeis]|uniref:START domain-containing protein n=1 Tax=Caballeronia udeis TaxID=1232866 RepID=A0A158GLE1_9BURK|nr:hypothetical protein [Caballeronia udeis]SAL32925.1 hypothetical protein AWB69_02904 [Caballeronia udeis]